MRNLKEAGLPGSEALGFWALRFGVLGLRFRVLGFIGFGDFGFSSLGSLGLIVFFWFLGFRVLEVRG